MFGVNLVRLHRYDRIEQILVVLPRFSPFLPLILFGVDRAVNKNELIESENIFREDICQVQFRTAILAFLVTSISGLHSQRVEQSPSQRGIL